MQGKIFIWMAVMVAALALFVAAQQSPMEDEMDAYLGLRMARAFSSRDSLVMTSAAALHKISGRGDVGNCDNYDPCSKACADSTNDSSNRACKNIRLYTQTTEGLLVVIGLAVILCFCPCCWPCCVVFAIPLALCTMALWIAQITAFRYQFDF